MKSKSSKRIENKKKKMEALLQITKLNENDRNLKKSQQIESVTNDLEPVIKRPKTDYIEQVGDFQGKEEIKENGDELGPSGKPKLYGEELKELKRMLREKTKKIRQQPMFRLRDMGTSASLNTPPDVRIPLFLSDIQHLIMYSQLGHHSSYSPARWCALDKYDKLSSTNVLVVENVSVYHFANNESLMPFLSSTFDTKLEVLTPNSYNSDIVKDLSLVPLTGTQMRKFTNEYGDLETAVLKSTEVFDSVKNLFPINEPINEPQIPLLNGTNPKLPPSDQFPRTQLLLSGWQMVEENYPLPIKGLMEHKYAGYILTKDRYSDVTPKSPMFGIDCEMCMTTTGELELARVSVVDESLNIFYDKLVKPDNKITDYLTRFSGITAKMMKNINVKLQDVQEDLRRLLPSDAILVGQSLSNDMHALKMMHPYVIDTSVIFNITGERARKTKLKTLTREFLSERIQEGNAGHCSTEDSIASLKLTQLKLRKSLYFGDAVMGNIRGEIRAYPELGTYNYATSMLKQTTKIDKTASVVGLEDIGDKYQFYVEKGADKVKRNVKKIRCISEKSCQDLIKVMCDSIGQYTLNIGHVRIQDGHSIDGKTLKNVDKWVREVYEKTCSPGLCVVLFVAKDEGNGCCFIQLKQDLVGC